MFMIFSTQQSIVRRIIVVMSMLLSFNIVSSLKHGRYPLNRCGRLSYLTLSQSKGSGLPNVSAKKLSTTTTSATTGDPKKQVATKFVFEGDSTSRESYRAAKLGPNLLQADVLVTDPPYCLLERRRTGGDLRDPKPRKRKLDDQPTVPRFESVNAYKAFTSQWLSLTIEIAMKKDATLVIWTNALGKTPITTVAKSLGYEFIGEYLWAKRTTDSKENSTKNEVLLRIYETALIFQPASIAQIMAKKIYASNEQKPIWSVITGYHDEQPDGSAIAPHAHPCHKPLAALEPLLRQWTKPDDLVFDPFSGSGGILQAALSIGQRRVLGIEKLPTWAKYSNDLLTKVKV
jgi:site-specific DNA-methyltransferase (adenine-specific)